MSTTIVEPPVDLVVLGLGFSGPAIAMEAALAGYTVVGIEKGPYWDFESTVGLTKYDEWGTIGLAKFDNPYNWFTHTFRNNTSQFALPGRRAIGNEATSGHGVGGMAAHFNGQGDRFSPWAYQVQSMTASRYGSTFLDTISPMNDVEDWPYTYAEIESYYTQFEAVWGLAGDTMGPLVPMTGTFPLPPHPTTPIADTYMAALETLGYNPFPCISFDASAPYVNTYGVTVNECAYDGWCVMFTCETGAKGNGGTRCYPALVKNSNFTPVLNSYIFRINVDQTTNLATSVLYYDAAGNVHEQPCSAVYNGLCQDLVSHMFQLSGIGVNYNPTTVTGSMGRAPTQPGGQGTGSVKGTLPATFNAYPWGPSFGGGYTNLDQADDFFDHTGLEFIGGAYTGFSPGQYASSLGNGAIVNQSSIANGATINSMGSAYKASLKNKYLMSTYPISFSPTAPGLPNTQWVLDLDPVYTDKYGDPLSRLTTQDDQNQAYQANLYFIKQTTIFQDILQKMGATDITTTVPTGPGTGFPDSLGAHLRGGCRVGTNQSTAALNMWHQSWQVPNVFAAGEATDTFGDNTSPGSHPMGASMYVCAEGIKQYLASPGILTTAV